MPLILDGMKTDTLENTRTQMRRGVLEMCILSIISEREAYPSDIIEHLKDSRLIVVEGTLYPLLNRLKKAELLDYQWRESTSGPPRKYYRITSEGERVLAALKDSWSQMVEAVEHTIQKTNGTHE